MNPYDPPSELEPTPETKPPAPVRDTRAQLALAIYMVIVITFVVVGSIVDQ